MSNDTETEVAPIPVTLAQGTKFPAVDVREDAAEFGAYQTISVPGNSAPPVMLLNRRINRHRAVIRLTDVPQTTDTVIIASTSQAAQALQGFVLNLQGQVLQIENQQPLYAVVKGTGPLNVSVLDESWQTTE